MTTNHSNWTVTGTLGQTYGGYLGFGRGDGASKDSQITSPSFSTESNFRVSIILKGNAGNDGECTSTLTFTLLDSEGNVVATGKVISDSEGTNSVGSTSVLATASTDSTVLIDFTYASGKTVADAAKLNVAFNKVKANIGLKSLSIVG